MTFMVQRRYKSSGKIDPQELDRIIGTELVPQLKQLPGFVRYVTVAFDDGRLGSMSVFEDEDSAGRSTELGRRWMSETSAMQNCQHDATLSGPVIAVVEGARPQTAGYTISRRYQTEASPEELSKALAPTTQAFKERAAGLVRWSAVALTGGGVITYGWFDSAESARQSSQVAMGLRTDGPDLARVLPHPPSETLTGKMLTVYT